MDNQRHTFEKTDKVTYNEKKKYVKSTPQSVRENWAIFKDLGFNFFTKID